MRWLETQDGHAIIELKWPKVSPDAQEKPDAHREVFSR
ncbi:hypothetical protein predicted by Glimmer/Critica [Salmonella enterica subsp. enterica serovar Weltevreden str. 2007-60-3289-1]|nr:hypothetical protein SeW_A2330 [Salmonella enterica subsp. enterica serovar Weltevreden str. HI_N05-537]CBY96213.1 hypothetical protein predicted by Glimmer/Critica [Salmonella enterica subsp. enterica serovar Weltevreden str. 2007-60-3289-1]